MCLLDSTMSWLPVTTLGNIAAKQAFGGGNQFQCHYHFTHLNTHLEMMALEPHLH